MDFHQRSRWNLSAEINAFFWNVKSQMNRLIMYVNLILTTLDGGSGQWGQSWHQQVNSEVKCVCSKGLFFLKPHLVAVRGTAASPTHYHFITANHSSHRLCVNLAAARNFHQQGVALVLSMSAAVSTNQFRFFIEPRFWLILYNKYCRLQSFF